MKGGIYDDMGYSTMVNLHYKSHKALEAPMKREGGLSLKIDIHSQKQQISRDWVGTITPHLY